MRYTNRSGFIPQQVTLKHLRNEVEGLRHKSEKVLRNQIADKRARLRGLESKRTDPQKSKEDVDQIQVIFQWRQRVHSKSSRK